MSAKAKRIEASEFDEFAKTHCLRWSQQSLDIVRALVVDGRSLQDVAASYQNVTTNHANALRWRFMDRMEDAELNKFTSKKKPDKPEIALAAYVRAVKKLDDRGYTVQQIIEYLSMQDVDASEPQVRQLLKGD